VPDHRDAAERYGQRVLGAASTAEERRLAAIAEVSDGWTQLVLRRLGLQRGWRCWEVGAGSGTVAVWLAERAFDPSIDSGQVQVLATDVDMRFLDRLEQPGLGTMRHDVVAEPPPAREFDLIHARFVLEHLPEREAVLDQLVDALAPDGWVVVESLTSFPVQVAADDEFRSAMLAVEAVLARTIGTDCTWSRRVPTGLLDRGLVEVGAAATVPVTGLRNASASCWSLTLEQLAPRIVELGLATRDTLDRAQSLLADPRFGDLGHGTLSVWGRRPSS
jgi:2-polyprenyl-3-methyl-5-hydroxy-6-metoxy-1,4-benzoquinol methylase